MSASPNRVKNEKLEGDLHFFGEPCLQSYKKNFPERDEHNFFIVPAFDARSQILSILDRRNGEGKPVFRLAPPDHEQSFEITAPNMCVPRISDDVLRQIISQASQLAQNGAVHV